MEFDEVLRQGGKDTSVFCAKRLALIEKRRPFDAVQMLHKALAITPQDAIATELLNKALEETSTSRPNGGEELEDYKDVEKELALRKAEATHFVANRKVRNGKGGTRSAGWMPGADGNSLMDLSDDD